MSCRFEGRVPLVYRQTFGLHDLFLGYGQHAVDFEAAKWRLNPTTWSSLEPVPPRPLHADPLADVLTAYWRQQVTAEHVYYMDADLLVKFRDDARLVGNLRFFHWSVDEGPSRWIEEFWPRFDPDTGRPV
jgi:hypothetical protein